VINDATLSDRRHRVPAPTAPMTTRTHAIATSHIACTRMPMRDHDGQDYGANNEPVEVHPPGEQSTRITLSLAHARLSDRPGMLAVERSPLHLVSRRTLDLRVEP